MGIFDIDSVLSLLATFGGKRYCGDSGFVKAKVVEMELAEFCNVLGRNCCLGDCAWISSVAAIVVEVEEI